jgi:energy-coupling factor transport system ATP-binding protein
MPRTFIAGGNFSGRSAALRTRLEGCETFFLGPYAEAALSGLSSTVADEIALYTRQDAGTSASPIDWTRFADRKPATLSGGEQVLLALRCFAGSSYTRIGIDTALEQLDGQNRAWAIDFLDPRNGGFDTVLIDNRIEQLPAGWSFETATALTNEYACDFAGVMASAKPRAAPVIDIQDLDFAYAPDRPIFRELTLSLRPGMAYRLLGSNGAGKTTFLKILVGVLRPMRGAIRLDATPYDPRRNGNAVFALATQNPDHQWCGATLAEDLARRQRALRTTHETVPPSDAELATLARALGIPAADPHLYELPLAARKRLSWLWPFSGAMPWIMLDEPTIGQDRDTRSGLAAVISHLCGIGYGVLIVTHDDDFAARFSHRQLRIEGMTIRPHDAG